MKHYILFLLFLFAISANADNKHYALQGKLGDNINFRLDLEEEQYTNNVFGETTYFRKDGKVSKIKVYGFAYDHEFVEGKLHSIELKEFLGTKVCGYWSILLNNDTFENGMWMLNGKMYDMNEIETLPTDDAPSFIKPLNISDATGVYKFTYDSGNEEMPEYGGTVQFLTKKNNLAYTICQVTPNIAEVQNTTSEFYNNILYVRSGSRTYVIQTYEDAVFISHYFPTDPPSEDFGANADITGVYIPTGEQPTGEILDFYAEEEEFSKTIPCSVFDLNDAWYDALLGETTFPDELILKDIDGDGKNEIIARYIPDKTEMYEVTGKRSAVFVVDNGVPVCVAYTDNDRESLEIADGYVIKHVSNARGSRISNFYTKIEGSTIGAQAKSIEAEINSFTIEGNTVTKKNFNKQIKIKNNIRIEKLNDWITIPGNEKRNENAARG